MLFTVSRFEKIHEKCENMKYLTFIIVSTKTEGTTFQEFLKHPRSTLHKFKNTINRAKYRKANNISLEHEEEKENVQIN